MKIKDFNLDWTFWSREIPEKKQRINLPHDAMIHEKRIPHLIGGEASGYFPGGYYYYEKKFVLEEELCDNHVELEFDGVYQKSKVFLNGEFLGGHIYGYSQFCVDFTGKLKKNEENVVRVEVDNTQIPNSRWYTGSGIYRDVKLLTGSVNHILRDGIKMKTNSLEGKTAVVTARIETTAESNCSFQLKIISSQGESVDFTIEKVVEESSEIREYRFVLEDVKGWSVEKPRLYTMKVTMLDDKQEIIDEDEVNFGIRVVQLDKNNGLCINGNSIKLRGACIHHDNGPLGACEYKESVYRRIQTLKQCGYNAVRIAHNPASRLLLEACDELGMYMMEELTDVWQKFKNAYDYSLYFMNNWKDDMTRMINKAYSHPSVIVYSIGNEIYDLTNVAGLHTNKEMADFTRELDETRPIINCIHILTNAARMSKKSIDRSKYSIEDVVDPKEEGKPSPLVSSKLVNIISTFLPSVGENVKAEKFVAGLKYIIEPLDILGINYGAHLSKQLKKKFRDLFVIHSETYPSQIGKSWMATQKATNVIGDFMWTGWDYLGESGIGVPQYGRERRMMNKPYPCISGGVGSVNLAGEIEAQGEYCRVVFEEDETPYIGVRPLNHAGEKLKVSTWRGTDVINSWSWKGNENKQAEIEVFSSANYVELIQNGRSLGLKPVIGCKATYTTIYKPGVLHAKAYNMMHQCVGESSLETAAEQSVITVTAEKQRLKTDGKSIVHLRAAITDEKGIVKMVEDKKIKVVVMGAAELIAVGSGNPITTEPYDGDSYTTYHGTMMAVIRSKKELADGKDICVRFETKDLAPVEIKIGVDREREENDE